MTKVMIRSATSVIALAIVVFSFFGTTSVNAQQRHFYMSSNFCPRGSTLVEKNSLAKNIRTCKTPHYTQGVPGYVAEIVILGGNYCPRFTLPADGRQLNISVFTTLFSLLGTSFCEPVKGSSWECKNRDEGRVTFSLPNLQKLAKEKKLSFCIATDGIYPPRN